MAKLKFFAVGAIVLCAAVVCVIIQHTSGAKYLAGVDALQQQSNRFTALTAEHDRLSNLVSRTSNALPENHSVELTKLRAEAEALRKQTNDFALAAASHNARPNALADGTDAPTPLPEDHEEQRRENMQARDFSAAFMWFAEEHSNRVPINLNQLAPYLTKMHLQMPPSDLFEIVFHGSTDQLHGIPFGSVAMVRSRQVWRGQDGKLTRIYGFLDGHGQQVSSDDNFKSYEALHVISTAPPDQSGQ